MGRLKFDEGSPPKPPHPSPVHLKIKRG